MKVLLLSSNTVLAEGFRGMLACETWVEFFNGHSLPSGTKERLELLRDHVVLIDSFLPHDGCRHFTDGIPPAAATRVRVVTPNARELERLRPSLPPHIEMLRADLTRDSILGHLRKIIGWCCSCPPGRRDKTDPGSLTGMEIETLGHVAKGYSNKEIAAARQVSSETVKYHLRNAMKKLGARTRTTAVLEAIRLGLVPTNPWAPAEPPVEALRAAG